jgi:ATP-dependent Lon protease
MNGTLKILVEGLSRAKMERFETSPEDFYKAHCTNLSTPAISRTADFEASWRMFQSLYENYAKLNDKIPQDLLSLGKSIEDIDYVVDTTAVHLNLSFEDRQDILETLDLKKRLLKISAFLKKEIDILEIEQRIRGRIQTQVEKNQREYYLTEQIKAIQKEIWNLPIEPDIKVRLTEKTGEIEFRIVEGSDPFIQLQALVASFVLAGLGKEQ